MSGVVALLLGSKPISVFCHMGIFGCGDGGWTPVMKIDGNQVNFYHPMSYMAAVLSNAPNISAA